jgi:hypothetical protein
VTLQEEGGGGAEGVAPAVLGELSAWIAVLDLVCSALLRCADGIQPAPDEIDPAIDLDQMDWPTEVRSVLRNVAESSLRPAIEDLRLLLQPETAG